MSCSCSNRSKFYSFKGIKYIDKDQKTLPFEICPYCAFKHLTYAFITAPKNEYQCIGELYLAFKHLGNTFPEISNEIIDLINLILSKKYPHVPMKFILKLEDKVHELALKYKEENENLPEATSEIDFDQRISDRFTVYISAANELFNHEQGYKDVNYKFVLGLLQIAVEDAPDEEKKVLTRNVWKLIEQGQDIDILDIFNSPNK